MSTLSSLQLRLSKELSDSENVNKTTEQRTESINDALTQIYKYRKWKTGYKNSHIQGVDGIFNIPRNMDKPVVLWYGQGTDNYDEYNFINQTDFLTKYPYSITVTESNGRQVLKSADDSNLGHDIHNYTGTSTIGINDVAAREQVGQTFTATDSTLYGPLLKLSIVGNPVGTLAVDIKATAASLPTGSSLATTTININEIGEDAEYFWAKFTSSVSLTENSVYSITVSSSYATDPANYVKWSYSTTSQITGSQVLYDGAIWTLGAGDQVFVLCSDYFNFQYTTKFIALSESSDDSGLPTEFDQAIAKMAAGMILETKGDYETAQIKFFGIGGNETTPTMPSARWILNTLWSDSDESVRPNKRLKTIFERRSFRRRYENNNPTI